MKDIFQMSDDDFKEYTLDIGFDEVKDLPASKLDATHLSTLEEICSKDHVSIDDYDRLSVAYGKTAYDTLRLREKQIDSLPDVVIYPSTSKEIEDVVKYASTHQIPLYVYGGGSSVTMGVEPTKGGISLDMRRNFQQVLNFNEVNQTITVQAGMSGPRLEQLLNDAVKQFGAKRAYTCGHFPQSFEYSSVGGCVVPVEQDKIAPIMDVLLTWLWGKNMQLQLAPFKHLIIPKKQPVQI